MKASIVLGVSLFVCAALFDLALAGQEEAEMEGTVIEQKILVAVKTDDVEIEELDISHLQPGDAETVMTESGRTIDVLRTEDDVEIYIDGERINPDAHLADENGKMKVISHHLAIHCDEGSECEELASLEGKAELPDDWADNHEVQKLVIVRKEVKTD